MGRHAAARRGARPTRRPTGQTVDRRFTGRRHGTGDVGRLFDGQTTRSRGPLADRAAAAMFQSACGRLAATLAVLGVRELRVHFVRSLDCCEERHVQRRREKTLRFLVGGGDAGARIRAHDWAATPLGPTNDWPPSLRTLVGLLLASQQPMFIAWGAEKIWIYNDPLTPILGDKHPSALGERSDVVWKEAWDVLKPLFDRVFAGEGVHMGDFGLMLNRHGRLQEAHFSFSYTPIFDERGEVSGLFGACLETTAQVIAIREREAAESRLQVALSAGEGIGTWDWDIK